MADNESHLNPQYYHQQRPQDMVKQSQLMTGSPSRQLPAGPNVQRNTPQSASGAPINMNIVHAMGRRKGAANTGVLKPGSLAQVSTNYNRMIGGITDSSPKTAGVGRGITDGIQQSAGVNQQYRTTAYSPAMRTGNMAQSPALGPSNYTITNESQNAPGRRTTAKYIQATISDAKHAANLTYRNQSLPQKITPTVVPDPSSFKQQSGTPATQGPTANNTEISKSKAPGTTSTTSMSPRQYSFSRNPKLDLLASKSYLLTIHHKDQQLKELHLNGVQNDVLEALYSAKSRTRPDETGNARITPLKRLLSLPGDLAADDEIDEDDLADSWDPREENLSKARKNGLIIDGQTISQWEKSGKIGCDLSSMGLESSALEQLVNFGDAIWGENCDKILNDFRAHSVHPYDVSNGFSHVRENSVVALAKDYDRNYLGNPIDVQLMENGLAKEFLMMEET